MLEQCDVTALSHINLDAGVPFHMTCKARSLPAMSQEMLYKHLDQLARGLPFLRGPSSEHSVVWLGLKMKSRSTLPVGLNAIDSRYLSWRCSKTDFRDLVRNMFLTVSFETRL